MPRARSTGRGIIAPASVPEGRASPSEPDPVQYTVRYTARLY